MYLAQISHRRLSNRRRGRGDPAGLEALRWELEELRVSLFAQELAVRGAVSPKKLAARLAALR